MSEPIREFGRVLLPVAKTCMVAVARILVPEPAVIQQEKIDPQQPGLVEEAVELLLVKIELGCFPVVEEGIPAAVAIQYAAISCPAVEVAAGRAFPFGGVSKNEFGGDK